jgi:hypothetical protein
MILVTAGNIDSRQCAFNRSKSKLDFLAFKCSRSVRCAQKIRFESVGLVSLKIHTLYTLEG